MDMLTQQTIDNLLSLDPDATVGEAARILSMSDDEKRFFERQVQIKKNAEKFSSINVKAEG